MTNPPPAPGAVLRPLPVPAQPLAPEPWPRPAPSRSAPPRRPRSPLRTPLPGGSRRLPPPRDAVQQIRLGRAHRSVHQLPHPEEPPAPEVRVRARGAGRCRGSQPGCRNVGRPGDCPLDPLCMSCCPHLLPLPLIPPCLILEGDEGYSPSLPLPPPYFVLPAPGPLGHHHHI